ncbi:MAG: DNA mismatch repair protein [Fibrobacter sp.]|nr:DNA mismatch repair protein [Fibrobacter sp.]
MQKYDFTSVDSVVEFAKLLKNRTLREVCSKEIEEHGYKGKGNFGQILEKFYFGYEPNSDAESDFPEASLELKSSPLKVLKNGEYRSKERLVLNIINYLEVHKETFEESSFWKKNAHLLLVFYLWEAETDILDYIIKLVDDWSYPNEDLKIIKHDWETINQKIKDGKAHEISEGDTFYLGACTKGSTALKSLRQQPFNSEKAKQRAYSLKQGYVNHIIAKISKGEKGTFGKIIQKPEILDKECIEKFIISKFEPFYNKTAQQIEKHFNLKLNQKAKSYFANLTNSILGIGLNKRIEEFEKADVIVKTIRLKENDLPKEDVSFPTFKYEDIIEINWEDSDFKNMLESKFFFVFYQFTRDKLVLRKVKFWNMPQVHIEEAKKVWDKTKRNIKAGLIVKEITETGRRLTYFPKKSESKVSHVRPHARNADDTYPLPQKDILTGVKEYTKHCFWINAQYVKDEIYEK